MTKDDKEKTLRKYKTRNIEKEHTQLVKNLPMNIQIEEEDLKALVWLPVSSEMKLKWIDEIIAEKKNNLL